MRNLKKVLALVLVVALSLTMFAGAFKVAEQSEELKATSAAMKEALYVTQALGIVQGYSDGTLRLDNEVRRGEFAAMIYRAKTGIIDDKSTLLAGSILSMFSDSVADWAKSAIAYAYSAGLMVGYPDGTIQAEKSVTGYEAAKIVLCALGYDQEVEGLVGVGFAQNTVRLATQLGLFKNINVDLAKPFSRGNTIQLIYNALYTETVQYLGNSATPKTLTNNETVTLGQEGFDLLDVEATLVTTSSANANHALGAYWRYSVSEYTDPVNYPGNYASLIYRDYDAVASKCASFVYKDWVSTNASNSAGYYIDRVITIDLGSQAALYSELGKTFRVLTTQRKDNYDSTELRSLYGVPYALSNSTTYDEQVKEINAVSNSIILNMANRYAQKNGLENGLALYTSSTILTEGNVTDYTVFINGAPATFAAGYRALNSYNYSSNPTSTKDSTSPVRYIDNDKDGIVDCIFITQYSLGKITSVEEKYYSITGAGGARNSFSNTEIINADTLAVGDLVLWYNNSGEASPSIHLKVLEGKELTISGVNGSSPVLSDGNQYALAYKFLDETTKSILGLTPKITTDANGNTTVVYTSLYPTSAIVSDTVYKFYFDGKYIVKIEPTENTKYENYGILLETPGASNETYLGLPRVKLFTETNETVYAFLKSVNGIQVTPYQYGLQTVGTTELAQYDLVNYVVDGQYVYVNKVSTTNFAYNGTPGDNWYNTSANAGVQRTEYYYNSKATTDFDFTFNKIGGSESWIGNASSGTVRFVNTAGTVFVTYGATRTIANDTYELIFRAYKDGEFAPNIYNLGEATVPSNVTVNSSELKDLVVYADYDTGYDSFNIKSIKAARISFNLADQYTLPGLPFNSKSEFMGILSSNGIRVDKTAEGWVYTYSYFAPWDGINTTSAATTIKSVPFLSPQYQPVNSAVVLFSLNEEGLVTAYQTIAEIDETGKLRAGTTQQFGEKGFNLYDYVMKDFYVDLNGNITATLSALMTGVTSETKAVVAADILDGGKFDTNTASVEVVAADLQDGGKCDTDADAGEIVVAINPATGVEYNVNDIFYDESVTVAINPETNAAYAVADLYTDEYNVPVEKTIVVNCNDANLWAFQRDTSGNLSSRNWLQYTGVASSFANKPLYAIADVNPLTGKVANLIIIDDNNAGGKLRPVTIKNANVTLEPIASPNTQANAIFNYEGSIIDILGTEEDYSTGIFRVIDSTKILRTAAHTSDIAAVPNYSPKYTKLTTQVNWTNSAADLATRTNITVDATFYYKVDMNGNYGWVLTYISQPAN